MTTFRKENIGLVVPLQGAKATVVIDGITYRRKVGLGEFYWDFGANKIMQLPTFWVLTYMVETVEGEEVETLLEDKNELFPPVKLDTPQMDNNTTVDIPELGVMGEYDAYMLSFNTVKEALFDAFRQIVWTMETKGAIK